MALPDANNEVTTSSTNQKGMTLDFLAGASFWANVALVAFSVLAAVAGAFALYFSSKLSAAEDAALVKFQAESRAAIAAADMRAAEANARAEEARERAKRLELELAGTQLRLERIRRDAGARWLDTDKFLAALQGSARGSAGIWYKPEDMEAWSFADQIADTLRTAGWIAPPAEPVPINAVRSDSLGSVRDPRVPAFRHFGGTGIQLRGKNHSLDDPKHVPFAAIRAAFLAAGFTFSFGSDTDLPDDAVTIIVGPK